MREVLNDDKSDGAVVEDAPLDSSAEPVLPSRVALPTRRVGKVSVGSTAQVVAKMTGTPPRRRAASVFGTRGREIVTYPEPVMTSASIDAAAAEDLPGDKERETGDKSDVTIDRQEKKRNERETLNENQETNDDASAVDNTRRRVYVLFKELSPDTVAAYIHVLMGLFADNPGDDAVALVFDGAQEIIETRGEQCRTIAAPNGVAYDEVSEVVLDIVGEDAVVEVIE